MTAEGELGVVIGRTCSDIGPEEASNVIAGFFPLIDVTAKDILQRNPRYLTRTKSFDSFLVIGPWIVVPSETFSRETLADLKVRIIIGGETVAKNVVENMAFLPHELVAFHSRVMTLGPGDVISTGTPGAGVVEVGDTVIADVDGVGSSSATVVR